MVLDAKDMKKIASRAEMDSCVPLGFHGCFAVNGDGVSSKL